MSGPVVKTKVTTRRDFTLTLDRIALLALMLDAGRPVPPNAEITFTVPGGGDWSNTTLDVSADNPITVTWTDTTEEAS